MATTTASEAAEQEGQSTTTGDDLLARLTARLPPKRGADYSIHTDTKRHLRTALEEAITAHMEVTNVALVHHFRAQVLMRQHMASLTQFGQGVAYPLSEANVTRAKDVALAVDAVRSLNQRHRFGSIATATLSPQVLAALRRAFAESAAAEEATEQRGPIGVGSPSSGASDATNAGSSTRSSEAAEGSPVAEAPPTPSAATAALEVTASTPSAAASEASRVTVGAPLGTSATSSCGVSDVAVRETTANAAGDEHRGAPSDAGQGGMAESHDARAATDAVEAAASMDIATARPPLAPQADAAIPPQADAAIPPQAEAAMPPQQNGTADDVPGPTADAAAGEGRPARSAGKPKKRR